MPYLADLLPFMVLFKRTLGRQSGSPAYHHQRLGPIVMVILGVDAKVLKKPKI